MTRWMAHVASSLTAVGAGVALCAIAWTPALAADLGGDCCADLEERVAELEATTVRKGNRKVSLKISGQVHRGLLVWDDGDESNAYVVDVDTSSTRFRLTGKAKIKPGWSTGYNIEIEFQSVASNGWDQDDNNATTALGVRRSAMYIKSTRLGTVWWGWWSSAADDLAWGNTAGTYISGSPDPAHYAGNIFLRPVNSPGNGGMSGIRLDDLTSGGTDTAVDLMFDPHGARYEVIRYDSPSFRGFTFSAAWGEDDLWDVALRYKGTIRDFKVVSGIAFGENRDENERAAGGGGTNIQKDESFFLSNFSAMHIPTGLFVASSYVHYDSDTILVTPLAWSGRTTLRDAKAWYIQGGIKKKILPYGKSAIFGWYTNIEDGLEDLHNGSGNEMGAHSGVLTAAVTAVSATAVEATGSEIDYWGIGAHQWIDAAALEMYVSFAHYDVDIDLVNAAGADVSVQFEEFWTLLFGGRIKF